ncbi:hypothetical protein ACNOYE_32395 [Nannocystaceae bacterium ST9]
MPIHVTLIPSNGTPYIQLQISPTTNPHLSVELKPDDPVTPTSYNAYYSPGGAQATPITEIEVRYYESSNEDFRLRGTTSDGGKPEIIAIEHIGSGRSNTRAVWQVSGNIIDWTFEEPTVGHWVSWRFNPDGTSPPVRVKVTLRRQS